MLGSSFIPSFHLDTSPQDKLKPEWALRVIQYYYYNANNRSLLWNKRIQEIEDYAAGDIDMKMFKRMFKSIKKKMELQNDGGNGKSPFQSEDDELMFQPCPLIPTPLNAAIATIQNKPIEISCTALDPLAATKKKEDVTFLKNKPEIENDLQELTDQMNISKIDLGTTSHSSIPFADSPYGLNLLDPSDYDVFVNILYKLGIETAFETILQAWWEIKTSTQIKLLEITDQFKFGVSCNRCFESAITGLPDMEYVYPANVFLPYSDLPDYADRTHNFEEMRVTPFELFNYFGNEICDEKTLEDIVSGGTIGGTTQYGYCSCNNIANVPYRDFGTFKMSLLYFEVKSIDWVGKMSNPKSKKGFTSLTLDDTATNCTDKIWGQNTYGFYWLKNTKHFLGIHRLGFSHRTKGIESYQNFSYNINRSQKKSAVENSIGENKTAQIAAIKLAYEVIHSKPSGGYFDIKYLTNAIDGLTDDNNAYTIDQLVSLAMERNIMIGDSSGFEGANAPQFKPFQEIVGGLNQEKVAGYLRIIIAAQQNIASFTGINQQLTGQNSNPDALVGYQKLQINASINALRYANEAIEVQYQKVMNQWAYLMQEAIKNGGSTKKAIVDIVGGMKADIIDRLDEVPLHRIGVKITLTQREEEVQEYNQRVYKLEAANVLTSADIFLLKYIPNIKDRYALLAVREKQWLKKQDQIRQEDYQQQQQIAQQQGQNMVASKQAVADGEIKKEYAKGDVQSKLIPLQQQTERQQAQFDAIIQKALQQDRSQSQIQKAVETINAKAEADNQKALA